MSATLLMLATALVAEAADCPTHPPLSELQGALDSSVRAYSELDIEGFQDANDELLLLLPCLDEPVDPPLAAELHRVQAISAFARGQEDHAIASLTAAKRLEPDTTYPEALVPAEHPLALLLAEAAPSERATLKVRPQEGLVLFADGSPAETLPSDAATVLQLQTTAGQPHSGSYHLPTHRLPSTIEPAGAEGPGAPRLAASVSTGVGALALAALAVLQYRAGDEAFGRFLEAPSDGEARNIWNSEVAPRKTAVVAASAGAGVLAVASAGLWLSTDFQGQPGPGLRLSGRW